MNGLLRGSANDMFVLVLEEEVDLLPISRAYLTDIKTLRAAWLLLITL